MNEILAYIGGIGMIGGLFLQIYFFSIHNTPYYLAAFITVITSFLIYRRAMRENKPFYKPNNYNFIEDEEK